MSQTTHTNQYDDLRYGDTIRYVGPAELGDEWSAPSDLHGPYTFRYESAFGTLALHTTFKGNRVYSPDHPANDRAHWEVVDE
jgi:hypothetical protein